MIAISLITFEIFLSLFRKCVPNDRLLLGNEYNSRTTQQNCHYLNKTICHSVQYIIHKSQIISKIIEN